MILRIQQPAERQRIAFLEIEARLFRFALAVAGETSRLAAVPSPRIR